MRMIKELSKVPCKCCNLEDDCIQCTKCGLVVCLDCSYYEGENEICSYCADKIKECPMCEEKIQGESSVKCSECGDDCCLDCVEQTALGWVQCNSCLEKEEAEEEYEYGYF